MISLFGSFFKKHSHYPAEWDGASVYFSLLSGKKIEEQKVAALIKSRMGSFLFNRSYKIDIVHKIYGTGETHYFAIIRCSSLRIACKLIDKLRFMPNSAEFYIVRPYMERASYFRKSDDRRRAEIDLNIIEEMKNESTFRILKKSISNKL